MKVKVKDCQKVDFKPVSLNITLTSEAEVVSLWHRLNISASQVTVDYLDKKVGHESAFEVGVVADMWRAIDTIVTNLKIHV